MKFENIDTMINDLSGFQFSILSDISCGMSFREVMESRCISSEILNDEVESVIEIVGGKDMKTAVKYYSAWIEEFERNAA